MQAFAHTLRSLIAKFGYVAVALFAFVLVGIPLLLVILILA